MILRRVSETGLRLTLGGILFALLVPTLMLVFQAYQQLERDTFFQYRTAAEELTRRIDEQLAALVRSEDEREFSDYGFLVVAGEDFVQRSPLSSFPVESGVPGARSYFQVDAEGNLTTPLVPQRPGDASLFGVAPEEYAQRLAVQNEIMALLNQPAEEAASEAKEQDLDRSPMGSPMDDALADAAAATGADADADTGAPTFSILSEGAKGDLEYRADERLNSQIVLDRLEESSPSKVTGGLGRVEDLNLDAPYGSSADNTGRDLLRRAKRAQSMAELERPTGDRAPTLQAPERMAPAPAPVAKQEKLRARRLEQNVAPATQQIALEPAGTISLETFTSEVDPFRFATLDSENFVLYRTVWRDQARFIQGLVIKKNQFLQATIGAIYSNTAIAAISDLIVAYEGDLLQAFNSPRTGYFTTAREVSGTLLHQARLSPPFNDVALIFSAASLPVSAGSAFVMWTGAALVIVLLGGFWLMYRLGLEQIRLHRQQQDFVSAVSHELKTPLTSIRMYGEILKAGWASEEKKRTYYDFIFFESERLSRLINNVLQLARLTRNGTDIELKPTSVGELVDVLRSKIASQIEQAEFDLVETHDDESALLLADTDSFAQIMINLVDNAIKFSTGSDIHRIEIKSRRTRDNAIEFSVRDYGPGVPKDQMRRIFELFYRTERELTRETVGTGIGLALVNELVTAMGGQIKAQNMEPGVEFRMLFPGYDGSPS